MYKDVFFSLLWIFSWLLFVSLLTGWQSGDITRILLYPSQPKTGMGGVDSAKIHLTNCPLIGFIQITYHCTYYCICAKHLNFLHLALVLF